MSSLTITKGYYTPSMEHPLTFVCYHTQRLNQPQSRFYYL